MGWLLGPAIVDGNRFQVLLNGDEIFPSMLSAIRSARRTITFETYIYWSGRIGKELADALAERARAGVKVHVLLDWVGSDKMEKAGRSGLFQKKSGNTPCPCSSLSFERGTCSWWGELGETSKEARGHLCRATIHRHSERTVSNGRFEKTHRRT